MQISKFMRGVLGAAVLAICGTAHAAYTVTISQVGPDVVASGSGSLNLTSFTYLGTSTYIASVTPIDSSILVGPSTVEPIKGFVGAMTGPTTLGSGVNTLANSGSGGIVGLQRLPNHLIVPDPYTSGTPLGTSTSTWNGRTIANLGLTPGTYTWSWGAGPTADTFTVVINAAPPPAVAPASIPTLSEWGLIGISGLLALFGLARVRRRD